MPTITFSNGVKVNFNGTPTQKDIEEIAAKVAGQTQKPAAPEAPQGYQPSGVSGALNKVAKPVGDLLGISKFGEGLGFSAAQGTKDVKNAQKSQEGLQQITNQLLQHALELPPASDRRKELLKLVQQNEQMLGTLASESVKDAPTNREFGAAAVSTAANIIGAGTLGTKAVGSGVAGATNAAKSFRMGKLAAMPLKSIVAQSAAEAGTLSAAKSFSEGKSVKDSLLGAIGPAAITGTLTLGTGLVARAITKKLTAAPENVIRRTVHQGLEDTKKQVVREATADVTGETLDESKDFVKTLLRDGVKGNDKKLVRHAITQVDTIGKKIKAIVGAPGELGVDDEAGKLFDGPQHNVYGEAGAKASEAAVRASEARRAPLIKTEKYRDFFDQLLQKQGAAIDEADQELLHRAAVGDLNIEDGYELRKLLDGITPKGGFAADPSTAVATRALTRASGDLRNQISQWSQKYDPNLQKLINQQSVYIRLRDNMADRIAKIIQKSPNISFQGLMNALSGAVFSPGVGTSVAQGIKGLNTGLGKTAGLRNLSRSAIISGAVNAEQ